MNKSSNRLRVERRSLNPQPTGSSPALFGNLLLRSITWLSKSPASLRLVSSRLRAQLYFRSQDLTLRGHRLAPTVKSPAKCLFPAQCGILCLSGWRISSRLRRFVFHRAPVEESQISRRSGVIHTYPYLSSPQRAGRNCRSTLEISPQQAGKTTAADRKSDPQSGGTRSAVGWKSTRSRLEKNADNDRSFRVFGRSHRFLACFTGFAF